MKGQAPCATTIEEYEGQLRFVSDMDMPAPSGYYDKSAKARAARSIGAPVEEPNPVNIDDEAKPKKKKKQKEMEAGQYKGLAIEDSPPLAIEDSDSVEENPPREEYPREEYRGEECREKCILIKSAMKKEPVKSAMKKYKKEEETVSSEEEDSPEKKKSHKHHKKPKSDGEESPQHAEKAKKKKKKKKLEGEVDAEIEEALLKPEKGKKKKTKNPESSQPKERDIQPEMRSGPTDAPACCTIL
jgi:hypothetical protein